MEKSCSNCSLWSDRGCLILKECECLQNNEYKFWRSVNIKKIKNPFDFQEGGNHYKIEGVMDVAEWSKRRGHCPFQHNIIKYVDRHKKKNGIEDLRKAKQYLEFIAYIEYNENL